jgi:hypothetical protein
MRCAVCRKSVWLRVLGPLSVTVWLRPAALCRCQRSCGGCGAAAAGGGRCHFEREVQCAMVLSCDLLWLAMRLTSVSAAQERRHAVARSRLLRPRSIG